jgi:hypothetical protein
MKYQPAFIEEILLSVIFICFTIGVCYIFQIQVKAIVEINKINEQAERNGEMKRR